MAEITNTGFIKEEFSETLQTLDSLTRVHALTYRLGVGQLLLDHLFEGDSANFSSKDKTKDVKFSAFVLLCAEELAQFNLSVHALRESIRATVVYNSLPEPARAKLQFSHLIQLARCTDGHKRLQVALATVSNGWTMAELNRAILASHTGPLVDVDPATPGTQITENAGELLGSPPDSGLATAELPNQRRWVTRSERLATELTAWAAVWQNLGSAQLNASDRNLGPQNTDCVT